MTKRGNGEGSIYKRSDGRWVGAITVSKDGRRRNFYGSTRAEVAKKLTAAVSDHSWGMLPTAKRQTVGDFLDVWLRGTVNGNVAPATELSYRGHVAHILAAGLGDIDLEKVTPGHVEHYMRSLEGKLSTGTIHNHRATLRTALNRAMRPRSGASQRRRPGDASEGSPGT